MYTSQKNQANRGAAESPPTGITEAQQRMVEQALETVGGISRTFKGRSDTSVSKEKVPLRLKDQDLIDKVRENFASAVTYLLQHRGQVPFSAADVAGVHEAIVSRCNDGLLAEGVGRYRSWDGAKGMVKPEEIKPELERFFEEFVRRVHDPSCDAVELAAWVEQRYNTVVHPLSDGCGRVSKAWAAGILIAWGLPYPVFNSREEYFDHVLKPFDQWLEFFRARIEQAKERPPAR
jgi:hypothetical protein